MSLPSEEQCMGLLDFSRPSIDVAVLEQVAQVFYNSQSPPEVHGRASAPSLSLLNDVHCLIILSIAETGRASLE